MPLNGAELADQTQDIDMTDHLWAGFLFTFLQN